ncbi:NYN domain-containing protein [Candidatus Saccharibacteria bacterium]|nr:MAG: NYN domain-containing protein [Candidatus Saccharibacteria bacterium]
MKFIVRKKKALKQIKVATERGFVIEEKGNMDVEMTIDMVNQIHSYDEAVLFSGDSDFIFCEIYKNKGEKGIRLFIAE